MYQTIGSCKQTCFCNRLFKYCMALKMTENFSFKDLTMEQIQTVCYLYIYLFLFIHLFIKTFLSHFTLLVLKVSNICSRYNHGGGTVTRRIAYMLKKPWMRSYDNLSGVLLITVTEVRRKTCVYTEAIIKMVIFIFKKRVRGAKLNFDC
jgi:hypothetical protein